MLDTNLMTAKIVRKDMNIVDRNNVMWIDDYLSHRISQITPVENQTVYNMSVEEDESYVANGIAVHNCMALWFSMKWLAPYARSQVGRKGRAAII